ncbi:MAG: PDZ domain-containing protein [Ignavibacteriota bacterium]
MEYNQLSNAEIGHVMADSPAAKAGIQDGDRIVALDGRKDPTWEDVEMKEATSAFRPMHVTVERNGKRIDATVTPVLSERLGGGYAGWDENMPVGTKRAKSSSAESNRGTRPTRPASRKVTPWWR